MGKDHTYSHSLDEIQLNSTWSSMPSLHHVTHRCLCNEQVFNVAALASKCSLTIRLPQMKTIPWCHRHFLYKFMFGQLIGKIGYIQVRGNYQYANKHLPLLDFLANTKQMLKENRQMKFFFWSKELYLNQPTKQLVYINWANLARICVSEIYFCWIYPNKTDVKRTIIPN